MMVWSELVRRSLGFAQVPFAGFCAWPALCSMHIGPRCMLRAMSLCTADSVYLAKKRQHGERKLVGPVHNSYSTQLCGYMHAAWHACKSSNLRNCLITDGFGWFRSVLLCSNPYQTIDPVWVGLTVQPVSNPTVPRFSDLEDATPRCL
jgi:hypothetical protein